MLLHLIAFGLIPTGSAVVVPGTGLVTAPADMTATAKPILAGTGTGTGIPSTAFPWSRPLDPSDKAGYAFDFGSLIGDANIASLDRIQLSALGTSLGLLIDDRTGRVPLIDTGLKKIGVYFRVADAFEFNAAFATAQKVGVSFLVTTDETPSQTFERTAVLTMVNQ